MSSRYDERRHERIARRLEELRAWRNAREHLIADWSFTAGGTSTSLILGDFWPVVATPVQFAASGDVPDAWAGEPVELELWLGGEGFLRLSTGLQVGLDPFHHSFPISEAAQGGERITIEAEVVPKGMFGSHVAEPRLERAHFVVPHYEVRALERDLTMIAQAAQELGDHEVVPHLLDIVEAAFAIYGPVWPSASDTASTRSKRDTACLSKRSMRCHCCVNSLRAIGFVAVSACRRQISASTLCVNRMAGHGSAGGMFTRGTRKSHTTAS